MNKLNAHGGFTPAASAPPKCDTLEQVLRHHRDQRRGGMGGPELSPPSSYDCFVVRIKVQGILQSKSFLSPAVFFVIGIAEKNLHHQIFSNHSWSFNQFLRCS